MSSLAIRVEGLGKRYRLGETHEHTLASRLGRLLGRSREDVRPPEDFWALRDVSFDLAQGQSLGIIGGNGAGKSTLLKILSRITLPTTGRARVRGRLASLLEVGTGFHPELTGRENVYLNGTILGMRKAEVARKFDEIVAFAGVEKFIDTPVKRYSSGMYVRLAFAVAAHLEPDVLIVDEVLAVGDVAFQRRCLGKMSEVASQGRTVLFVSHNMASIRSLCVKAAWLQDGQVVKIGDANQTVDAYLEQGQLASTGESVLPPGFLYFDDLRDEPASDLVLVSVQTKSAAGSALASIRTWDEVVFEFNFRSRRKFQSVGVEMIISTPEGVPVLRTSTSPDHGIVLSVDAGDHGVSCRFERLPLSAGDYVVSVWLTVPRVDVVARHDSLCRISVGEADVFRSGFPPVARRSCVAVPNDWRRLGRDA